MSIFGASRAAQIMRRFSEAIVYTRAGRGYQIRAQFEFGAGDHAGDRLEYVYRTNAVWILDDDLPIGAGSGDTILRVATDETFVVNAITSDGYGRKRVEVRES